MSTPQTCKNPTKYLQNCKQKPYRIIEKSFLFSSDISGTNIEKHPKNVSKRSPVSSKWWPKAIPKRSQIDEKSRFFSMMLLERLFGQSGRPSFSHFLKFGCFLGTPAGPTFHIKSIPVAVGARWEIYEKTKIFRSGQKGRINRTDGASGGLLVEKTWIVVCSWASFFRLLRKRLKLTKLFVFQ